MAIPANLRKKWQADLEKLNAQEMEKMLQLFGQEQRRRKNKKAKKKKNK